MLYMILILVFKIIIINSMNSLNAFVDFLSMFYLRYLRLKLGGEMKEEDLALIFCQTYNIMLPLKLLLCTVDFVVHLKTRYDLCMYGLGPCLTNSFMNGTNFIKRLFLSRFLLLWLLCRQVTPSSNSAATMNWGCYTIYHRAQATNPTRISPNTTEEARPGPRSCKSYSGRGTQARRRRHHARSILSRLAF